MIADEELQGIVTPVVDAFAQEDPPEHGEHTAHDRAGEEPERTGW
jgi:hypothetical protein